MVHWGFLILAFVAGFASCYCFIYHSAKVLSRINGAIEKAGKYPPR